MGSAPVVCRSTAVAVDYRMPSHRQPLVAATKCGGETSLSLCLSHTAAPLYRNNVLHCCVTSCCWSVRCKTHAAWSWRAGALEEMQCGEALVPCPKSERWAIGALATQPCCVPMSHRNRPKSNTSTAVVLRILYHYHKRLIDSTR